MTPSIETAYRALSRFTSYTAWRHFEQLQRNQRMPLASLERLRWHRLRELLHHANQNIPFYRALWENAGVNPEEFTTIQEMERLPVITKADLIKAQAEDAFGLSRRNDFETTRTSGTTGPCLYLPFTRKDLQLKYAAYLREFYATGWRLGMRSAAMHYCGHLEFGGRYTGKPERDNFVWTRNLVFRIAHRRKLLKPYALPVYRDVPLFGEWYRVLRRHRPYLLETMDFNLLALYRYIREHNLPPLHIPKMIVLTTFAPELKRHLEAFFHTEIFNRFGPHEIEGVAYSCPAHHGLHVSMDSVYVEFLDDRHLPVKTGQVGHLVLTDLDSRLMPLIRYKIGDVAYGLESDPCACGRTFPLMSDIQGRARDQFTDDQGRPVPAARVVTTLQGDPGLDLFQAVQDKNNRVNIRTPRPLDGEYATVIRRIKSGMKTLLGESTDVTVTINGDLELEPNGKYCFARRI